MTLQVTLLPPPVTIPLHWFTDVTSCVDVLTVVVQPKGGSTPAAARQAVAVTVELVAPDAVTLLSIVMVQVTSNPAPVGMSGGLHWATAGAVPAAEATGPSTSPLKSSIAAAKTNVIAVASHRRKERGRTERVTTSPLRRSLRPGRAVSTR
jgi:hypothetical protein